MTGKWSPDGAGILPRMNRFGSVREAKEYLIDRILAQADRDGVALSEVERKMLYFSETGWTLPDMMAVSQEFDETYDQSEYEGKVGEIVRRIQEQPDFDRESWKEAVRRLRDEDHYLSVLIDGGYGGPGKTSRWDTIKAILAGIVLVLVFLPASFYVYANIESRTLADAIVACALLALALLAAFVASRGRKGAV